MRHQMEQATALLRGSEYTVALTGAGISTPSGIPDFRSQRSGIWYRVDPFEVASLWSFVECPDRFHDWLRPLLRRAYTARPNLAHRILARMELVGRVASVITQNVDSLHQRAGSRCVVELHGHTRTITCMRCGLSMPSAAFVEDVLARRSPFPCPGCGGRLKLDVVLFGEPIPDEALCRAQHEALTCQTMLVVGSSLEVMPAADLPLLAKRRGARLILVNREATLLDDQMDVVIRADVVKALRELWSGCA